MNKERNQNIDTKHVWAFRPKPSNEEVGGYTEIVAVPSVSRDADMKLLFKGRDDLWIGMFVNMVMLLGLVIYFLVTPAPKGKHQKKISRSIANAVKSRKMPQINKTDLIPRVDRREYARLEKDVLKALEKATKQGDTSIVIGKEDYPKLSDSEIDFMVSAIDPRIKVYAFRSENEQKFKISLLDAVLSEEHGMLDGAPYMHPAEHQDRVPHRPDIRALFSEGRRNQGEALLAAHHRQGEHSEANEECSKQFGIKKNHLTLIK